MKIESRAGSPRIALGVLVIACVLQPAVAEAQRAVDLQVGSWTVDGRDPTLYSAGLWRHVTGPLGFRLRGFAAIDPDTTERSLYGLTPEVSLFRGARELAPYATAGLGLAYRSGGSSEVVAVWSAGLGIEWNPQSWFSLAAEASRFVEDEAFHGFWNLKDDDRRGWSLSARLSIRWGGRSARSGASPRPPSPTLPPAIQPGSPDDQPAEPLGPEAAALAGRVVQTAIGAMGEPYRWGGTSSDEGFDCSGLIWYSYRTHGVAVPRVSRDQARTGRYVHRDLTALEPGDILLFAERGTNVSHVGLYLGSARFIHATTSGGVRISSFSQYDSAYDAWWLERWIGARRVLR